MRERWREEAERRARAPEAAEGGERPEAGVGAEGDWAGGTAEVIEPRTEDELAEAVRQALRLALGADAARFSVEAHGSTIRLSGLARSEEERNQAVEAVRAVLWVDHVDDEVRVEGE